MLDTQRHWPMLSVGLSDRWYSVKVEVSELGASCAVHIEQHTMVGSWRK